MTLRSSTSKGDWNFGVGKADGWSKIIGKYRLRYGLSQAQLADTMGVSQRTISRWERGDDQPGLIQQKRLRDLGWEPPGSLLRNLAASVAHCPVPRALSRTQRLRLLALSPPALEKRPSMAAWIGCDLVKTASGVLQDMLEDAELQRAIRHGEIAGVRATTQSVLKSPEAASIGRHSTTVTYFFHDGTLFSDAISVPAPPNAPIGYSVIPMDDVLLGL